MVGAVALFGAQVAAPRAGWQPFGHHAERRPLPRTRHQADLWAAGRPADRRRDARRHRAAAGAVADAGAGGLRQPPLARRPRRLQPARTGRPAGARSRSRCAGSATGSSSRPGRIAAVRGAGRHDAGAGRRPRRSLDRPTEGEAYRVEAATVHTSDRAAGGDPGADREALPDPDPDRPRAAAVYIPFPLAKLADHIPPPLKGTDWASPVPPLLPPLAGRRRPSSPWSGGSRTTCCAVAATTTRPKSAPPASNRCWNSSSTPTPGYCQHFAGAAALLLRIAGVPTRVVGRLRHRRTDRPRHLGGPRRGRPRLDRGLFPRRGLGPVQPDAGRRPGRRLPRPRRPPGRRRRPRPAPGGTLPQLAPAPPPSSSSSSPRPASPAAAAPPHPARRAPGPPRPPALRSPDHPAQPPPDLDRDRPRHRRPRLRRRARPLRPTDPPRPPHPTLTVWRALVSDVGLPARSA